MIDGHSNSVNWYASCNPILDVEQLADHTLAYISAEMSALKPVEGGFVRHANMWLDKSTGIAIGQVHYLPDFNNLL